MLKKPYQIGEDPPVGLHLRHVQPPLCYDGSQIVILLLRLAKGFQGLPLAGSLLDQD